jgi:FdhD protein
VSDRPGSTSRTPVTVVANGREVTRKDELATEEPLEIRIKSRGVTKTLAITMRTPGADFDLATGFLFAEGVVETKEQIQTIAYCRDPGVEIDQLYNIVTVDLDDSAQVDLPSLERHFHTSSACGVCGKASLEALSLRGMKPLVDDFQADASVITGLTDKLRDAQKVFASTGGLHAAGLFDGTGKLAELREDVGRHNALDKLIGSQLMKDDVPLAERIVMVSGRSSFEILQKCLVAGVPVVCAVSAPSSLAVDVAREFNITLIGFLRADRFNIYSGSDRIQADR